MLFVIATNGMKANTALTAEEDDSALSSATDDGDDWMRRLPDDTFVAKVSIPGSHDSATGDGFDASSAGLGESFAQTQELSIDEQWALGIRAFDLRPASYDGYLHIHHGIVATARRFDDVLFQLRDSLKAHPTEFVVIHLLHESDGDQSDDYN